MKTVQDALIKFDDALKSIYDKPEINAIKYLTISEVLMLSKAQLRAYASNELTKAQSQKLAKIIKALQTGKPIQYILGETEFYGLPFKVTPSVLIPRPETEELVEWIISIAKQRHELETILDIGTGSGCIPITLKTYLPSAKVSAIDISARALTVAKQNAQLNDVEVNFIKVDILKQSGMVIRNTHYSIIVSNPPYITDSEKSQMHTNVLSYEPHLALFVTDHNPLIFYNAIANFALQNLKENGLLFFEINENLGKETVKLLQDKGFKNIQLRQDMRGTDRMVAAELTT
ncbi:MAG: peptide chain release factor N(5)-glutamine methyltransferase [Mucilaginibacter sp.]|uniref:peptide chain release factor N(5)-glutamine methyltransferase n=1 Tax=Mucilaginibacter sp. TaxID=1882438 RepID=UPI0032630D1D